MKWYTCPDCGKKYPEGFVPQACENCGCPSEAFELTEDANSTKYVTVCPDCGKTWDGSFPSKCDNCGCPSENFIKQEVIQVQEEAIHNVSTQPSKSSAHSCLLIAIVVLMLAGGGIGYAFWRHNEEKENLVGIIARQHKVYVNADNYSLAELHRIAGGSSCVDGTPLKRKMMANGDYFPIWVRDERTSTNNSRQKDEQKRRTSTTFRHERDVHQYLRNHEFTDSNGKITISESYNMALKFNGRELTGAIVITEFNSYAAYFTAHSPISGLTYQFIVNCEQGVLYCVSDGTTYYAR